MTTYNDQAETDVWISDTPVEELPPLDIPVQQRKVLTDKQDIPVDTLVKRIQDGTIHLQPEFQRNFVWSAAKASQPIDSLLLNVPIPVVYVAETSEGDWEVVDGQQRLTSISAYLTGSLPDSGGRAFTLSGFKVLSDLNGKRFF